MKIVKGQSFPLGVEVRENVINFAVAAPIEKSVKLLLYKEGSTEPDKTIAMNCSIGEVRCIAVEEMDSSLCYYNYEIQSEVLIDPYVKAVSGKSVWGEYRKICNHEIRGKIYQEDYDWEDDHILNIPCEDVIAYSLHVRGFTMDSNSDVLAKGTFEGIVEKIPYLKDLGINQIQCMPVYEFEESVEPVNYWGYGPAFWFSPKNAYSIVGDGVKSFKDMVKSLHKAGIEIVLEMPFHENIPKQMRLLNI